MLVIVKKEEVQQTVHFYFQSAGTQAKAFWKTFAQKPTDPSRAARSETLARKNGCLVKATDSRVALKIIFYKFLFQRDTFN